MSHSLDLPRVIPLFPLLGALLLPRTRLPLHVFEARYLALLDDALKTPERLIGIIQPCENVQSRGQEMTLQRIGCAGRVTGFSETEDGRYMITLTGISRFRLQREIEGFTPYRRAEVDWNSFPHDRGAPERDREFCRGPFLQLLGRYLEAKKLSTDWTGLKSADEELLINSLAMLCPFDPEDRQALLEAPSLATRRETMVTLFELALRGGPSTEILQ